MGEKKCDCVANCKTAVIKVPSLWLRFLCMFAVQVSLGSQRELLAADYDAAKLPKGKQSVFAKGQVAPDPKEEIQL